TTYGKYSLTVLSQNIILTLSARGEDGGMPRSTILFWHTPGTRPRPISRRDNGQKTYVSSDGNAFASAK
ncbi:hypothetical protein BaRGS_00027849, partial [Batillaria attramentaria]